MRMNHFLALLLICFFQAGCTTPSKPSKMEYLTGEAPAAATEKDILDDISRTIYVTKATPMSPSQLEEAKKRMESGTTIKSKTNTWVQIYPYTRPLIEKRIRSKVEDLGFKERWDTEKIQAQVKSQVDKAVKNLITAKQCFAVEIHTNDKNSLDLKYWYGSLTQAGIATDLKFTEGEGYVERTSRTTITDQGNGVSQVNRWDFLRYFYYADACSSKPIDLTGEFKLVVEPRFERFLEPMQLEWLTPVTKK